MKFVNSSASVVGVSNPIHDDLIPDEGDPAELYVHSQYVTAKERLD